MKSFSHLPFTIHHSNKFRWFIENWNFAILNRLCVLLQLNGSNGLALLLSPLSYFIIYVGWFQIFQEICNNNKKCNKCEKVQKAQKVRKSAQIQRLLQQTGHISFHYDLTFWSWSGDLFFFLVHQFHVYTLVANNNTYRFGQCLI